MVFRKLLKSKIAALAGNWFSIGLCAAAPGSPVKIKPIDLNPSAFGFEIFSRTESGRAVTEISSKEKKNRIRLTLARDGQFESQEEYDANGALAERITLVPGQFIIETFLPYYKADKRMIPTYGAIDAASAAKNEVMTNIGANAIIDDSCKNYAVLIQRTLEQGLSTGLRCLAENGFDGVAAKLLTIHSAYPYPIAIACADPHTKKADVKYYSDKIEQLSSWDLTGANGQANVAYRDKFPAIAVDSANLSSKTFNPEKSGLFFHEDLHLLGYEHNAVPDMPYLSDFCCFDGFDSVPSKAERQKLKERSCALMKDVSAAASSSKGCDRSCLNRYYSTFATLMNHHHWVHLAYESAWHQLNPPLWNYDQLKKMTDAVVAQRPTEESAYLAYVMGCIGTAQGTIRLNWRRALKIDGFAAKEIAELVADFARLRARFAQTGASKEIYETQYAEVRDRFVKALKDKSLTECDGLTSEQKKGFQKALAIVEEYLRSPGPFFEKLDYKHGSHYLVKIKKEWPAMFGVIEILKQACAVPSN